MSIYYLFFLTDSRGMRRRKGKRRNQKIRIRRKPKRRRNARHIDRRTRIESETSLRNFWMAQSRESVLIWPTRQFSIPKILSVTIFKSMHLPKKRLRSFQCNVCYAPEKTEK